MYALVQLSAHTAWLTPVRKLVALAKSMPEMLTSVPDTRLAPSLTCRNVSGLVTLPPTSALPQNSSPFVAFFTPNMCHTARHDIRVSVNVRNTKKLKKVEEGVPDRSGR